MATRRVNRNRANGVKQQPAVSEALPHSVEAVRDYPITSAMAAFGVGIGVGAGILLWKTLRAPQGGANNPYVEQLQGLAERIGKQVTEAVRKQLS